MAAPAALAIVGDVVHRTRDYEADQANLWDEGEEGGDVRHRTLDYEHLGEWFLGDNPVVFTRTERKTHNQAAREYMAEGNNDVAGAIASATPDVLVALFLDVREAIPIIDPASAKGRVDTFRAPFEPLIVAGRKIVECPRGHRVQVTRSMLVGRAEKAWASGDRFPTI